jgi:hypothetical protein
MSAELVDALARLIRVNCKPDEPNTAPAELSRSSEEALRIALSLATLDGGFCATAALPSSPSAHRAGTPTAVAAAARERATRAEALNGTRPPGAH